MNWVSLIVEKFSVSKVPSQTLVDSIHKRGVLIPIAVVEGDVTTILDGRQRVAACKILGIREIPAFTVRMTKEQLEEYQRLQPYRSQN